MEAGEVAKAGRGGPVVSLVIGTGSTPGLLRQANGGVTRDGQASTGSHSHTSADRGDGRDRVNLGFSLNLRYL